MNYERINWEDGTQVEGAYVEIDGTRYPVVMPTYNCSTPVTANNLNIMDNALYEVANKIEIPVSVDETHFSVVSPIKMYKIGRCIYLSGIVKRIENTYNGQITVLDYPIEFSPATTPIYFPAVYRQDSNTGDFRIAYLFNVGSGIIMNVPENSTAYNKELFINIAWIY